MIGWLDHSHRFPPLECALKSPNGLLAAGGDLSVGRLLAAYRLGIFPWFAKDEPILWWCPNPRLVLVPTEVHISRSLGKVLRNTSYEIRFDTAFKEVMYACAAPREGQQADTWISDEMVAAYCELFERGLAHSVETWVEGQLVGGLYGVTIGRMFYGESMFSQARDASKIALVHLCQFLKQHDFTLIDCQMHTSHLASMGAKLISRQAFIEEITVLCAQAELSGPWTALYGKSTP
jgi:leucyl/phenylalanyl-tRNA--protein transferase